MKWPLPKLILISTKTIEIYGDVFDDVLEKVKAMTIPFQHFKTTRVGYVRKERFE